MAELDGSWNVEIDAGTLGTQKGVLDVKVATSGESFKGTYSAALGTAAVTGTVDGDDLAWKMNILVPMATTIECKAVVTGDTMTGTAWPEKGVDSYPLSGTRA